MWASKFVILAGLLITGSSCMGQQATTEITDGNAPPRNEMGMHACPLGFAITGVLNTGNVFTCRRVVPVGQEGTIVSVVDTTTLRSGMHACPAGMYMRGLHVDHNLLLCSKDTHGLFIAEFVDSAYLANGMHSCNQVSDRTTVMTGIHVDNGMFLCSSR